MALATLFSPPFSWRAPDLESLSFARLAASGLRPLAVRGARCPCLRRHRHRRPLAVGCQRRDDGFYMRRCVELARTAVGCTSPNPMVGCVIVRDDGEIVGEGFHPKAGQPHAEVFALRDAGALAENATAYVSLEPCNHYGRTPPCTEALIRAKVKQVVVGMTDPNPIVSAKGIERLRQAGINVVVGVEEALCRKLNEPYIHRMITGKPFLTFRYTLSLNGRILNQLGKGMEESGGYYSQLLQECDAVIMSSNPVESSRLPLSQEPGANQPLYVIISRGVHPTLPLPFLTKEPAANVVVLADEQITVEPEFEGIELVVLEQLNLNSVLDFCGKRGLCNVLIDLRRGDGVFFEDEHLVQKIVMEILPVWNESKEGSGLAFGWKSFQLRKLESRRSHESIIVEGYL